MSNPNDISYNSHTENNDPQDDRLSKVSHEMRTPLNAVLGMSDMILRATDGEDVDISEIHSFAKDIKNAGEELLQLTSDYLYISDVRPDQADETVDEPYTPLFQATNAKILVVDDNSVNRRVFKNLLRETGVEIDEAEGGYDCIGKTAKTKYDLIFLDYMMPDQNGIKTLEKIKEDSGLNKGTPVIALTASSTDTTKEKLKNSGFDGFLSKPIISEDLEKMISGYLPKEKVHESIGRKIKAAETGTANKSGGGVREEKNDQLIAIDIARVYANDKEELEGYFRDIQSGGSFEQYLVKIHSMKTSALMVKAYEPWALAKSLEDAAENENIDFITSVHPVFISSWMVMGEQLEKDYLYSREGVKSLTPEYEIILNYLGLLAKAVENIDIDSADTLMEMIRSYWYPEDLAGLVSRLNTSVAALDSAATGKCVSELERRINENYITDR